MIALSKITISEDIKHDRKIFEPNYLFFQVECHFSTKVRFEAMKNGNEDDSEITEPTATTVLSLLPAVVLEMIFSYFDRSSFENFYEADPYMEHLLDGLISIETLKEKLYEQEQKDFTKRQFALWRERLKIIHGKRKKKLD